MTLELGIAQIGLADTDSHRLRTMSGMAATGGSLKYRWVMREPVSADLVVISASSWRGESMIGVSANGHRQTIAVLAGESDTVPEGCLRLNWPIRIEGIVSLLQSLEAKIDRARKGPAAIADTHASPLVRLASIIREGADRASETYWSVRGISKHPLVISLDEKAFYCNEPLARLAIGPDSTFDVSPLAPHEASASGAKKPLQMLQWLLGLRTAPIGLLPWIDGKRALSLTRYPPFPILHHTPAHRQLAAALSRPCAGVQALERITGSDTATVTGFINAVSLCGFLTSVEPDRARAPATREALPVIKRSLIQSFRRALGMASAHE